LVRGLREQVASARASDAADEASASELGEQVIEVRLRDLPPACDIGSLHGASALVLGEVDHGADAVVTLGGEEHVRSASIRPDALKERPDSSRVTLFTTN